MNEQLEISAGGYLICEWCGTEAFNPDGGMCLVCDCNALAVQKGDPTKIVRYREEE